MKPARNSQRTFEETKLLTIHRDGVASLRLGGLAQRLNRGDLLVVNQSGTLPSSFTGRLRSGSSPIEIRLAAFRGSDSRELNRWSAVSFGEGDWRTTTEARQLPASLAEGDVIDIAPELSIHILSVDASTPRLVEIEFRTESPSLITQLYRFGRPIQYSYLQEELKVWDQQTLFSGAPISVEPPSSAFQLSWAQILELQKYGVRVVPILHGAGLSSTGDEILDRRLPLAEYFEIPDPTAQAVAETQARGGRIVALGTTVARALESAFQTSFRSRGYTDLKLGPATPLKVATALITGMHEPGTSHAKLMEAFCDCERLKTGTELAEKAGYRSHEYGDLMLLDCSPT